MKLKSDSLDKFFSIDPNKKQEIPLLSSRVSAGFPSSAENYLEKSLDLNELLVQHAAATFFLKVKGNSMINARINDGDILIVDRALTVRTNKIIIARINDELTVKRILINAEKISLHAENDQYKPIEITSEMDFEVWGVVTYVIHKV
ncbi:translesion error-prone DNA polymerase V autoproteolytic subunit [Candidatus Dependentiae bacterium]|nr:translesion error-prone DNA polymerase V autoproteolytic subunit [Candidatus Dependentiae bacterium]